MVRFPGNLKQVRRSLVPRSILSVRTDEEEEGRPRPLRVGGRSNAVVYARVGLSYILTAKLLHLQRGNHIPQTFIILKMNCKINNGIQAKP